MADYDVYPFILKGNPVPEVICGELVLWPIVIDANWYKPSRSWNIPNPEVEEFYEQLQGSMGLLVKIDNATGNPVYAFGFDNPNDAILFKLTMNP